jgi:hypothetical protein
MGQYIGEGEGEGIGPEGGSSNKKPTMASGQGKRRGEE